MTFRWQFYCIFVDLVKYYKNTALEGVFLVCFCLFSFFFLQYMSRSVSDTMLYLKQENCNTVFVGGTEGDAWVKSLWIIFQINEKMFPIKISIWLISSWLIEEGGKKVRSVRMHSMQIRGGECYRKETISASKDAGCCWCFCRTSFSNFFKWIWTN